MENNSSRSTSASGYSPFRTAVLICTVMLVTIYLLEMAKKEGLLDKQAQGGQLANNPETGTGKENNTDLGKFKSSLNDNNKPIIKNPVKPIEPKQTVVESTIAKPEVVIEPVIAQKPEPVVVAANNKTTTEEKPKQPVVVKKSRESLIPVIAHFPAAKDITKPVDVVPPKKVDGPLLVQVNKTPLMDPNRLVEESAKRVKGKAHEGLGKRAVEQGDYASAIKEFQHAIDFGASSASLYYSLARAYVHQKDHSRGIEYYSKAIRLSPNNAVLHVARAVSYHAIREYQKAVDDNTLAIAIRKNYLLAYRNRALAYLALGEKQLAAKDISTANDIEAAGE